MSAGLRHVLALCACLTLLPAPAAWAADYGFRVLRAELQPDEADKTYRLDADIDYRFSEPALDALRNGVSLTLVLRLTVKREHGWWEGKALEVRRSFLVRYHALSRLYQIVNEDSEIPRNFTGIDALLEAMGSLRGLPLGQADGLARGGRYRASLTVSLDIESLPLPLRPVAYVTPAWHLDSPVYQWIFVG